MAPPCTNLAPTNLHTYMHTTIADYKSSRCVSYWYGWEKNIIILTWINQIEVFAEILQIWRNNIPGGVSLCCRPLVFLRFFFFQFQFLFKLLWWWCLFHRPFFLILPLFLWLLNFLFLALLQRFTEALKSKIFWSFCQNRIIALAPNNIWWYDFLSFKVFSTTCRVGKKTAFFCTFHKHFISIYLKIITKIVQDISRNIQTHKLPAAARHRQN